MSWRRFSIGSPWPVLPRLRPKRKRTAKAMGKFSPSPSPKSKRIRIKGPNGLRVSSLESPSTPKPSPTSPPVSVKVSEQSSAPSPVSPPSQTQTISTPQPSPFKARQSPSRVKRSPKRYRTSPAKIKKSPRKNKKSPKKSKSPLKSKQPPPPTPRPSPAKQIKSLAKENKDSNIVVSQSPRSINQSPSLSQKRRSPRPRMSPASVRKFPDLNGSDNELSKESQEFKKKTVPSPMNLEIEGKSSAKLLVKEKSTPSPPAESKEKEPTKKKIKGILVKPGAPRKKKRKLVFSSNLREYGETFSKYEYDRTMADSLQYVCDHCQMPLIGVTRYTCPLKSCDFDLCYMCHNAKSVREHKLMFHRNRKRLRFKKCS
mmetsp:Transcript_14055/g.21297  ORF Transcript_14055/g.21297 Transcript_14055/m.21297 type:complete len:371 (+) Transcript_14055:146-1258(+)